MANTRSQSNNSSSMNTSSSLVTSPMRDYYDVFVSFRGKDTRLNFTDHLFAALKRKGIYAFRDDTNLKKCESIDPELHRAIQNSQVFVVVFSKNYASSTWCLRELECILQCVQLSRKHVLPVFCDVDPSEVRHQKGSYGEAFSKHEEKFQCDSEMVQKWREALTQVANLSGCDVHDKSQHVEIEKIVEEIINILSYKFSSLPKDLVGMHSPIQELENHLHLDSVDDVRVVGICGMGGIGKTTLATILYDKIRHQFPLHCLIEDVSKIYRHDGPICVQKQIIHQTLGEEHLQMCNLYSTSNLIRSRLRFVKSLLILDNVDQDEQLEKLAVSREWLGAGSRIIIVSRDEHILKKYEVDVVYKVPLLNENDSLQLFSRKAFKLDHIVSSYDKLARNILEYANGLPLAIKVLGSFLFDRNVREWESALEKLRECPNKNIMNVLRLSFDGLEENENKIFLHVACFFDYGYEKIYVTEVLNCCGFHAEIGLRILSDKSLISISKGLINMHCLFQELGKNFVQESSTKESRKWSRVWLRKQLDNVTSENMEKNVEAIVLEYADDKFMDANIKSLSKMSHLKLLIIKQQINISESLYWLSNELRYVEWHEYPFMDLPLNFHPNQLVELILDRSSIKQLWEGKKYLPQLKTLDLKYSKDLIKMDDFSEIPNLERLDLEGCVKLIYIHPSIGVLRKLVFLNLKDCKNLASISNNIFGMSSLKYLNLSRCSKVFKNLRQLKKLDSSKSSSHSQSTSSSILKWTTHPKDLASSLLHSLFSLSCLHTLDISFCGISQLPNAIGCLHSLEELNLGGNNFVTLPSSLKELSKLAYLNLEHCKLLESLPHLPSPTAMEHMRESLRKGLVIFNCPKLAERERCFSMAFSWMLQFIQPNPQFSTASFYENIEIVIPGSEMPSWFNNQSEFVPSLITNGNHVYSIRINLSPIMHNIDNHLIGLCCNLVSSFAPVVPTTSTETPDVELEFYRNDSYWYGISIPVILERELIALKSYHMYIVFFPLNFLTNLYCINEDRRNIDSLCMKVSSLSCKGLNLEVQKFGHRWVYKEDLQQMHHIGNSLNSQVQVLAIEEEAQLQ